MTYRISRVATAFVIFMGAIHLLGWHFNLEWFTNGLAENPYRMKPNTALCFVFCGTALGLLQHQRLTRRWQSLVWGLAGVVIAIASLTLIQYIFGWNFGIDELLVPHLRASPTTPYPGRMGESVALNFIFIATSLLLLAQQTPRHDRLAQILTLIVALIALVPLVGHLFGSAVLYELLVSTTSTAFNTALTFLLLSVGILFTRPQQGLMQTILSPLAGGMIARRLLPWAIALPLALSWLIFQGYKLEWYDPRTAYACLIISEIVIFSIGIYIQAQVINRIEGDRQESQRWFQSAIMNSPVPIMLHAEDGEVLQINTTWSRISGYQLADIPTLNDWTEKAYQDRTKNPREPIQKIYALEAGQVLEKEQTVRTKTGENLVWYFYAVTLGKTGDRRKITMSTAIDITVRKQAEQALLELNQTLEKRIAKRTIELEQQLHQRQQIEANLRASQALLNSLIECNTDIITAMDTDYNCLVANEAAKTEFSKLFGRSFDVGDNLLEALSHLPSGQANAREVWERAFRGENFSIILELGELPQDRAYYELNYSSMRDASGEILGASLMSRNVNARIKADQALRESEARFQAFMNHSPALAWISDREGKIVYSNQNLASLFGQSVEELLGKTPFDLHPRDIAEQHVANTRLVADGGEVVEAIESAFRSDGSLGEFLVYKFPIEIDGGEHLVGGVGLNITNQIQAEKALRESEAKLKAILDNAPAGIFLKDLQGKIVLANQYILDLLQISEEQCLGKTSAELIPGEFSEQIDAQERNLLENGVPYSCEEYLPQPDGIHTYYTVKLILHDLSGQPYGICGITTDISDRKRAEIALLEAKEAAEAANLTKSAFLANMSHELRTPLNAILGFSQILAQDSSLNPPQREQIAIINSSGEHLLNLINDVLEISKIEAGRSALHLSSFDFYSLITGLEAMLQVKAASKGLQIIFDRDSVPQYITTDESKLRQVLTNLVGNAIKFTREGGVSLRVRATELKETDLEPASRFCFYFEIEDTGMGIAEEELPGLFTPFHQTATGRNASEGTGLGLSISRKFVQMMGGDIEVSSRLNVGTLVKFTIQVSVAQASDLQTASRVQRIIGLEPDQPSYRILVVDDRPESRRLIRCYLEPLGFEVREAENGQQALEVWENWEPHLIVMDMQMPVMNGYEATRQIRSHLKGQATVVIALTASAFEENRSLILSAGCDEFLRKPCRQEVLLETFAQHLGVRYRYEDPESGVEDKGDSWDATFIPDPSALQGMPLPWIGALHNAALAADSEAIEELIQEIPEGSGAIAHCLQDWTDNFRFDKITELTQELLYE
ncbi:PAS domain S-box protein [Oscillatoria acuminata]|uniref:Circadian input-output histidine kinase CikA n=1 Tax=Oscillatoria acuminata PCC 6304 TaxID=56110 RepID=K9TRR5_9CYAN|nr:PAS domain S-box protein [Oscillatoria acuminata]AFY85245.1 PAS domain S-box [Oscillatoria acuminata PCC 6304]